MPWRYLKIVEVTAIVPKLIEYINFCKSKLCIDAYRDTHNFGSLIGVNYIRFWRTPIQPKSKLNKAPTNTARDNTKLKR